MKTIKIFASIFFIGTTVILSGCGSSKPSRFYSLTPVKPVTGNFKSDLPAPKIAIGIRTLKLPDYLLRQQMVERTASNEIHIQEFDRWAEPLEVNFSRVLIEDLSSDIPTNNISLFPARDSSLTNYQLMLEVTEFERNSSGTVTLTARWGIIKGEAVSYLMDKRSSFTEQVSGDNQEAIASAMSRLIGKLSEEITIDIRNKVSAGK